MGFSGYIANLKGRAETFGKCVGLAAGLWAGWDVGERAVEIADTYFHSGRYELIPDLINNFDPSYTEYFCMAALGSLSYFAGGLAGKVVDYACRLNKKRKANRLEIAIRENRARFK